MKQLKYLSLATILNHMKSRKHICACPIIVKTDSARHSLLSKEQFVSEADYLHHEPQTYQLMGYLFNRMVLKPIKQSKKQQQRTQDV